MRANLLSWFEVHGRDYVWRRSATPLYEQIVAELLLQRTRSDVVASRLAHVLRIAPNWKALATVSSRTLGSAIRPLGLWRRRVSSMKTLAKTIVDRGGDFPSDREGLERLPGIGQYMASAILVMAYGSKEPYLDVNMARILERCFGPRHLADIRYDPDLQRDARRLVNVRSSQRLNWAILDLGALVCAPSKPDCAECPLARGCDFAARTRKTGKSLRIARGMITRPSENLA
jgi:A/G-specific adenine glycosylase